MSSSLIVGIIGAIATVVSGIGGVVITLCVKRRREQKKEVRCILEVLQEIEADLKANRVAFDELEEDRDKPLDVIDQIGFPAFYHDLPAGPRKRKWEIYIDDMRDNNRKILFRLRDLIGNQELSSAFIDGSQDFRNHADEWERMWKLAMELKQEPESNEVIRKQQRNRRRFPSSFESSLRTEIDRLKSRYKRS